MGVRIHEDAADGKRTVRRGRHRGAATVGGVLAAGALIVITALLTDTTGWLLDIGRRSAQRDNLVVSFSGGEGAWAWLLPPGVKSPFGSGEECASDWPALGRATAEALPASNEWRVDVTGPPGESVIIHSLSAKIVESQPIQHGSVMYVCAIGGGVSERVAALSLVDATATEYFSSDNQDLRGLSYQLTPGEHGSFYVWQKDYQRAQGIYRFEVLMEYSDQSGTHTVNLHELTGTEPFLGIESCGVLTSFGDGMATTTPCP